MGTEKYNGWRNGDESVREWEGKKWWKMMFVRMTRAQIDNCVLRWCWSEIKKVIGNIITHFLRCVDKM